MEYPFPNAVKDSLLRPILSYGKSDQLRESNCPGYRLQSEDPLCGRWVFRLGAQHNIGVPTHFESESRLLAQSASTGVTRAVATGCLDNSLRLFTRVSEAGRVSST